MKHLRFSFAIHAAVFAFLFAFLPACQGEDPATLRAQRASSAEGDLIIAAAWPWTARTVGLYAEGLDMAVEEINADGGVRGRNLRIVRGDDGESVDGGRLVAQRFADDPDVVAVIGHLNSHISIPAADIYERGGLLMMTPASTAPNLTRKGYKRVFRTVPNDEEIARQLADLASVQHWRKVYVVYVRTAYGEGLANAFELAATGRGVDVVGRGSYGNDGSGLEELVEDASLKRDAQGFDAVLLAGVPPEAGVAIAALRRGGVETPVFGGDALDTVELLASAGDAAEGVYVASVFHPDDPRPEPRAFRQAFEARYDRPPDSWAARGYETVHVLAQAMRAADSAAPEAVAAKLREQRSVKGITSTFRFDEHGDVVDKRLITAVVRDGQFVYHDTTGPLAALSVQ